MIRRYGEAPYPLYAHRDGELVPVRVLQTERGLRGYLVANLRTGQTFWADAIYNDWEVAQGEGILDTIRRLVDPLGIWEDAQRKAREKVNAMQDEPPQDATPSREVASEAKAPEAPAVPQPRLRRRRAKTAHPAPGPAGPAPPRSTGVLLAQAIAEEMGNPDVTRWADDLAAGRMSEREFTTKLSGVKHPDADGLFRRARDRVVAMGVSPDDPLLQDLA